MRIVVTAALVLLAGTPVSAHRLDEYLQGTIISVEKERVQLQMTLTPGVAIFPFLIASIDTNKDGVISESEQRAYVDRILRDVTLGIDGHPLKPQLGAARFPTVDEMKAGGGEIQLDFSAVLPIGSHDRKLTFENHHQSGISAYLVNSLVPKDPDIRIAKQDRNYSQSQYQLQYEQSGVRSGTPLLASWASPLGLLGAFVVLIFMRLYRLRTSNSTGRATDLTSGL